MLQSSPVPASLFEPGRNCWRVGRTERLGLIVDAAEYFARLRQALLGARRQVLLIGWDFDFEIDMLPGESDEEGRAPDGLPNALGPFLEAIIERAPDLRLYILKWDGAILAAPGRILPALWMDLFGDQRIHFALDSHHPLGGCHHQKVVVVDDALAFCGGIDATEDRWDTSDHAPDDPRRKRKDGSPSEPWHDATTALTGPIARDLGDLARRRWALATGQALEPPSEAEADAADVECWPDGLPVAARDVEVAVARTEPPYDGQPYVNEIERLYLDSIEAAREVIYIESQYLTADTVNEALERRLREPDGPEVLIVNPQAALSSLEDKAMHPLRGRAIERLEAADRGDRFRIWHPANAAGEPIYVHAKVFVVDDRILRIGSSNLDNRSMGLDTECDVAFEGRDPQTARVIGAFRARLLAEHLGTTPEAVERAHDERGSWVAAVEALNPPEGRGLRRIVRMPEGPVARLMADHRLLDPRYRVGRVVQGGFGLRPRHLRAVGLALAAGFAAGAGWLAWRRWSARGRDRD